MRFCSFKKFRAVQTRLRPRGEVKAPKVSVVDARGKPCPVPILELAKALKTNAEIELWADDPAAAKDLDAYCEATGARVKTIETIGSLIKAIVVR